jgi:hypothetical protein
VRFQRGIERYARDFAGESCYQLLKLVNVHGRSPGAALRL